MKFVTVVFALLFSASLARGDEPLPHYANDVDCWYCAPMEIDRLAALVGDDALRDMVCRLSSERFTPSRLGLATGLPEGQVLQRINTLRSWGLVRMVRRDSATTIVEPLPGDGARTLRRWASRYCSNGDECGTQAANTSNEQNRRAKRSDRVGTASSQASGGVGLKGNLVTVFGGSGFIGRELVKRLVDAGARVRVASRNPRQALWLTKLGDDRPVELMAVDIGDNAGIEKAIAGADMVVNLVGIIFEKGPQTFPMVHTRGVHNIAHAVAKANVSRLVLVSAIGADVTSASHYSKTKAQSETAARDAFPEVTVVRPSIVFGPEDRFFNRIATIARASPILPVYGGGKTVTQPVYVGDVGDAIVRILQDPGTKGQVYELGGPRKMTLREIYTLVMAETGHKRYLMSVPFWFAEAQATILEKMPNPLVTRDQVTMLRRDNVVNSEALGLADLGITPTRIEDIAPSYLGSGRGESKPAY